MVPMRVVGTGQRTLWRLGVSVVVVERIILPLVLLGEGMRFEAAGLGCRLGSFGYVR